MRIAFISYEFPPDTAFGGIATYVAQISRSLAAAGAEVEVFCGSPTKTEESVDEHGVRVTRIKVDRMVFPTAIVPAFIKRHRSKAFDVIEGPDFLAEARYVTRALPHLPYVVKLHTPFYFARKFGRFPYNREQFRNDIRLLWYVAKTRNVRALASQENPLFREERNHLLNADEIAAPSRAIANIIVRSWGADPQKISLVPYTYEPPPEMLAIPIETQTKRISFVGRLEWRKGVQDLAPAIPLILERHPDARFRFVGATGASPFAGMSMQDYLCSQLAKRHLERLEFTGKVPLHRVPHYLADTDICVFPSRWESFGFVVLEAMSAGRAVVCTGNGGMAELVDGGEYGLLVPPKSPRDIANRINYLLDNPSARHEIGRRARTEGLRRFTSSSVIPVQLQSYERAIARRAAALAHVG
ncbi:glycosyltransferase family 1 protein [Opitutaceae bacterium EW11]|nr:glycosyltransferase family 1 protein [Opitutaceae bacterium EW11]